MEPPVDERNMRFKCINQYRDIIGPAKTFNGVTLCLPFQLPGILILNSNLNRRFVSRFFLEKKTVLQFQHPNDGFLITVTITLKWLKRRGSILIHLGVFYRRLSINIDPRQEDGRRRLHPAV